MFASSSGRSRSCRFRDPDNDADGAEARYHQRPFVPLTDTRLVDTGELPEAENDVLLGGEAAFVLGPFSLQGEAAHIWLQQDDADDASGLWGGYLGASYFLTGESRNYEADEGVFRRVRVTNPVQEGGLAAWEVGHSLRLPRAHGDAGILGGEMRVGVARQSKRPAAPAADSGAISNQPRQYRRARRSDAASRGSVFRAVHGQRQVMQEIGAWGMGGDDVCR